MAHNIFCHWKSLSQLTVQQIILTLASLAMHRKAINIPASIPRVVFEHPPSLGLCLFLSLCFCRHKCAALTAVWFVFAPLL